MATAPLREASTPPTEARTGRAAPTTADDGAEGYESFHASTDAPTDAQLGALRRGVSLVRSDPSQAARAFVRSALEPARYWLIYLEWVGGRRELAIAHLRLLADAEEGPIHQRHDGPPDIREILMGLRSTTDRLVSQTHIDERDDYGGAAVDSLLRCDLVERHPAEAALAFDAMWGSSRDGPVNYWRLRCLREGLRAALAPGREELVFAAIDRLLMARLAVYHWVELGSAGTDNTLVWLLLAPSLRTPTRALNDELRRAIARLERHARSLRARVARFRALADELTPTLAEAVCAVAARQGHALEAAQCRQSVQVAATQLLVNYLSIGRDDPDGE